MIGPALTVYALTEDAAEDADEVIQRVVRASLRLLVEGARLDRLRFEPRHAAHEAVKANIWKSASQRDHQRRVDLLQTLATNLCLSNCVVVFHFDGDTTWRDRERSENLRKFQEIIVHGVRQWLIYKKVDSAQVDAALRRLVAFVPHYTMESWLYQNTPRALERCGDGDRAQLEAWSIDRAVLDEVVQPWKLVTLGKRHNAELAREFPAQTVYDVGKSYAASVDRLRAHPTLVPTLEWTAREA